MHSIARSKGKELIVPDDVDTLVDDELSSGSSLSLSLSLTKITRAKSHKRPLLHPVFNDTISCASHRARRKASKG